MLIKLYFGCQFSYASLPQFQSVDSDVAINDEEGIRAVRAEDILVVHVAQVDFGRGPSPIAWVAKLEAHLAHIVGNFFVANGLAVNEGLLGDNLKLATAVSPKAEHGEARLGEVGVVQGDAVEGEDGLDEIVESDRLDERGAVIVDNSLTTFGNLLTQTFGQ